MKFENRRLDKALVIILEGFATDDKAEVFVDLLKKEVAQVPVKDYSLVIDSTKLLAFKPDILPVLEQSYKLYMSFGFKQVYLINPQNITAKMQLKRIARNTNFTGIFVDTYEETKSM